VKIIKLICHADGKTNGNALHVISAPVISATRNQKINSIKIFRRPLFPYGYGNKAFCSDRVKPSFVIFDIRAL